MPEQRIDLGIAAAEGAEVLERGARAARRDDLLEEASAGRRIEGIARFLERGDEATARAWLRGENSGLNGRPIELMQSTEGLVRVVQYLDASRGLV